MVCYNFYLNLFLNLYLFFIIIFPFRVGVYGGFMRVGNVIMLGFVCLSPPSPSRPSSWLTLIYLLSEIKLFIFFFSFWYIYFKQLKHFCSITKRLDFLDCNSQLLFNNFYSLGSTYEACSFWWDKLQKKKGRNFCQHSL